MVSINSIIFVRIILEKSRYKKYEMSINPLIPPSLSCQRLSKVVTGRQRLSQDQGGALYKNMVPLKFLCLPTTPLDSSKLTFQFFFVFFINERNLKTGLFCIFSKDSVHNAL